MPHSRTHGTVTVLTLCSEQACTPMTMAASGQTAMTCQHLDTGRRTASHPGGPGAQGKWPHQEVESQLTSEYPPSPISWLELVDNWPQNYTASTCGSALPAPRVARAGQSGAWSRERATVAGWNA